MPIGFQCLDWDFQTAAENGDIRLSPQSLCQAPLTDVGELSLAADRQLILSLANEALSEVAAAGNQQVGLSGKFLVQAPVTRVYY